MSGGEGEPTLREFASELRWGAAGVGIFAMAAWVVGWGWLAWGSSNQGPDGWVTLAGGILWGIGAVALGATASLFLWSWFADAYRTHRR